MASHCLPYHLKPSNLLFVADQKPEVGNKGQMAIGASLGVTQSSPVFGEMAIIDGSTRMAAAVAASECKLLVLHADQFASCMQVRALARARMRAVADSGQRIADKRISG